jgi:hypothetical protein
MLSFVACEPTGITKVKTLAAILCAGLAALPVAGVITFLAWSFWGWFEVRTGIESLGHSGPADWCCGVTYVFVLATGLDVWLLLWKKRSRRQTPPDV